MELPETSAAIDLCYGILTIGIASLFGACLDIRMSRQLKTKTKILILKLHKIKSIIVLPIKKCGFIHLDHDGEIFAFSDTTEIFHVMQSTKNK